MEINALTHSAVTIENVIKTPIKVTNTFTNKEINSLAIWDTGATHSVPVDFAILFRPGFIPIVSMILNFVAILPIINSANTMPTDRRVSYFITCATSLETALFMKSFMVVPAAVAA